MVLKDEKTGTSEKSLLTALQRQLRENLCPWRATGSSGELLLSRYCNQAGHLEELLTRTLKLGESNSALVIAPRGTGKSVLLNLLLERLRESGILGNGLAVRLSGLVQTDDRLALKEITSQLRLESATANKVFASFAENLSFLLECLRCGSKDTSKPVVFILDEFDLFCHHRNQTLLYNLFDVAQSAQAPICVIGLTSRLDVIELLEKRVKSRFSHRQIHLFSEEKFDPHYLDTFRVLLQLPSTFPSKSFTKEWNANITALTKDANACSLLKRQYDTTHDVRSLKTLLMMAVCQIRLGQPQLTYQMLEQAQKNLVAESKTNVLQGLSILQLCLVVAMKHLTTVYEGEPFNFEMVFREYMKFCCNKSSMQSYERPVIFKAYDQLKSLELVRPVDNSRGVQREYQLVQLMMTPYQVNEAILQLPGIPTDLQQWASSDIV
ncbi:origin recognition complex subunit 4-like [Macrobrachium nipponense]|uniref:origin recognition complex subunit 4-like n=1 Tax=Macrobrachium nipponense TaxID=159736 RepID=UPI0030C7D52A